MSQATFKNVEFRLILSAYPCSIQTFKCMFLCSCLSPRDWRRPWCSGSCCARGPCTPPGRSPSSCCRSSCPSCRCRAGCPRHVTGSRCCRRGHGHRATGQTGTSRRPNCRGTATATGTVRAQTAAWISWPWNGWRRTRGIVFRRQLETVWSFSNLEIIWN